MPTRTALLLGATGLVGGHCLELLLEASVYERVVSLGRRPLDRRHAKLTHVAVDFDCLEEAAEHFAVDDVFCCLGTTMRKAGSQEAFRRVDFGYPLAAARLAVERGAGQFLLVSALGADASSRIFYNRVKGEVEQAVRALPFNSVHLFRPSLLLGDRRETRAGERAGAVVMRALSFAMVGPLRKYQAIEASNVAAAMVTASRSGQPGVHVYESDEIRAMAGGER